MSALSPQICQFFQGPPSPPSSPSLYTCQLFLSSEMHRSAKSSPIPSFIPRQGTDLQTNVEAATLTSPAAVPGQTFQYLIFMLGPANPLLLVANINSRKSYHSLFTWSLSKIFMTMF